MLMFFIKIRHDWPDKMLELFFGVSDGTAANYVDEVTEKICESFVPRLFYLPKPEEVVPRIPKKFKDAYPTVFFIATRHTKQFLFRRTLRTIRLRSASTSGGQRCKWCFVRCLAVWCFGFHESSCCFS